MRARVGYLNCLFSNCLTSNQFMYSSVLLITSIVTELMSSLCRLLCDTMIQPFFDYVRNAQYPNLNKKFKTCLQAAQKKYIRFCLKLGDRTSIKINEFEKITWLPNQSIYTFFHKFHDNNVPGYMNEIFSHVECNGIPTRCSYQRLKLSHFQTNQDLRALSYIGPSL